MRLDMTINLGQVLSVLAIVVGGIGAYFTLKESVTINSDRISSINDTLKDQKRTNESMVRALNSIERDIAVIRYRTEQPGTAR